VFGGRRQSVARRCAGFGLPDPDTTDRRRAEPVTVGQGEWTGLRCSPRALMVQAQEQGARLVHFPEGAVSGYPGDSQAKAQLVGESFDWAAVRRELELTAALAGELRL